MSFFVKAKYDYLPTDNSLLQFRAGAVIEVISQLESGWWDGLLDESTRGWFPSNYVELIPDKEALASIDVVNNKLVTHQDCTLSLPIVTLSDSEYIQCIDNTLEEITVLNHVSTHQLIEPLSEPEKVAIVSHFVQCTTTIVQNTRKIVSHLDKVEQEKTDKIPYRKDIWVQMVSREATTSLSVLVLRMRELTKHLYQSADFIKMRHDYLNELRSVRECTNGLINLLQTLKEDYIARLEGANDRSPMTIHAGASTNCTARNEMDDCPSKPIYPFSTTHDQASASQSDTDSIKSTDQMLFCEKRSYSPLTMTDSKSERSSRSDKDVRVPIVDKDLNDKSSYMGIDISAEDIVFSPLGKVKGGTLQALVVQLTRHDMFDSKYTHTFMVTYRSFTTTEDFIQLVIARYFTRPPLNLTDCQRHQWNDQKKVLIQLRAINIIKLWLEMHCIAEEDSQALDMIQEFVEANTSDIHIKRIHKLLLRLINRCREGKDAVNRSLSLPANTPKPILPHTMNQLSLLYISPVELSRQLTLMESALFASIRPSDCLGKSWGGSCGSKRAKGVMDVIAFHNAVIGWVTDTLLTEKSVAHRTAYLEYFILVGENCRLLNNFSSMWAIVSALNSASIYRLRRTWNLLSAAPKETLSRLNRVTETSRNYQHYRETLCLITPPCVPFFGVYSKDLTFIEDGNPDRLYSDSRLINFSKRDFMADIISEIRRFQVIPYNFERVDKLVAFIEKSLAPRWNDDERFQRSLLLEPRQPPTLSTSHQSSKLTEELEDHLAKMLRDNGFI